MGKKHRSITGLPDDLGIGEDLARAEQRLQIHTETRRYGKPVTIVDGFDRTAIDIKAVASTLKKRLGVGGTVEGNTIELQGRHSDRLPTILREEGFTVEA